MKRMLGNTACCNNGATNASSSGQLFCSPTTSQKHGGCLALPVGVTSVINSPVSVVASPVIIIVGVGELKRHTPLQDRCHVDGSVIVGIPQRINLSFLRLLQLFSSLAQRSQSIGLIEQKKLITQNRTKTKKKQIPNNGGLMQSHKQ